MSLLATVLAKLVKDTLLFVSYVKNNAFPQPLTDEEEQMYIEQMEKGSQEARNKLIEHNLRLVAHIVKKFNQHNHLAEDLISIGTIGLIKGVESYIPGKGTKLATYAARCIENEILMFLRTLRKQRKDISLHSPIGQDQEGNEISLFDVIEAENEDIMEYVQLNMQLRKLKEHFNVLDQREQTVLIYRYGLNNEAERTQKEIADMLGISRSYVSRIEKRALLKVFRAYYDDEKKQKNKKGRG